jgi:ribonucleoside-triphosphate reductase
MRTLEVIDKELAEARDELAHVEGGPAEVYSRIVGYYRSVRNWNKGKKEEYGERKMFNVTCTPHKASAPAAAESLELVDVPETAAQAGEQLLLFVQDSCPSCPQAKAAAGQLGLPVEMVDAGSEKGLKEAQKLHVMSTPTAILFSGGREVSRARDAAGIAAFKKLLKAA